MTTFLTKSLLAVGLGASALTAAIPAEAQYYRGRHHRDDGTGTAIIAGVAGLAIGAAIASSSNRDRRYRDDRYYRDDRSYNDSYRYDNYNNYPRYNNYYNNDRRYNDRRYNHRQCRIERRYDPYYGRSVRVRVCY